MCCLDITFLSAFVATAQEDHELIAILCAVDPVPRSMIDPQLEDAMSYRLPVAAKANAQPIDSCQHARSCR